MRRLTLLLLLCACATKPSGPAAPAGPLRTSSPGNIVHFELDAARLQYRVLHGATEVLAWSPLGITRSDQDFTANLSFAGESSRPIVEEYDLRRGKRLHHLNRGVERTISFRNAAGARLDVEVRVFDDGFGFRYRF